MAKNIGWGCAVAYKSM